MKRARIILCGSLWLLLSLTVSAQRPFTTQIAALSSQPEAEEKVRELKSQGLDAYWIKSNVPGVGVRYRIRIGRFATRAAAQSQGEKLRRSGLIESFFIAEYEAPPKAAQPSVPPVTRTPAVAAQSGPASRPRLSESAVIPTPKPTPKPAPATISEQVAMSPAELKNDELPGGPAASEPVPATLPGNSVKAGKPAATKPGKPVNPGFLRFQDPAIGYSFEHPASWSGAAWSEAERMAQNVDGGAVFQSQEDNAFLNVIWNRLPGANDPKKYENTRLVDTIVKSMSAGADTLNELSREVEDEDGQIRTRLELNALFRNPQTAAPLNFLGKAVITRCQQGILLVVVFYSQDARAEAALNAERLIRSVRAPQ